MAEYVNKKYLDRKFQIDMMCLYGGTIFDTQRIINSLPTADVIERSKIDKTKDAIKELYTEWENTTDDARLESNPFGAVLNIIQRNIGE